MSFRSFMGILIITGGLASVALSSKEPKPVFKNSTIPVHEYSFDPIYITVPSKKMLQYTELD